jgi:hypothetical protein
MPKVIHEFPIKGRADTPEGRRLFTESSELTAIATSSRNTAKSNITKRLTILAILAFLAILAMS